jgi:hypothetical protein
MMMMMGLVAAALASQRQSRIVPLWLVDSDGGGGVVMSLG